MTPGQEVWKPRIINREELLIRLGKGHGTAEVIVAESHCPPPQRQFRELSETEGY
jgi:hypothetical protein